MSSILVISEIGINHNGSVDHAKKLVDEAINAGVDVAKFQLFSKEYANGKYEHLRLSREAIKEMEKYCYDRGIKFACTAFSVEELDWLLKNTNMAFVKIGHGQETDKELLELADKSGLQVIQSLAKQICTVLPKVNSDRKYLHCVGLYPTSPEMADLKKIHYSWCSGLSDHSGNIFVPLAAVSLGAKIIECHLSLSKQQIGPDHTSSLEPHQFKQMVEGIRILEKALA